MPKIKDNDHEKFTVVLSPSKINEAMKVAIQRGVNPKIAANTSAFLRYLVECYTNENIEKTGE
jgi:hypothetical protein